MSRVGSTNLNSRAAQRTVRSALARVRHHAHADGRDIAVMPRVGRVLTPRVVISLNCRVEEVGKRDARCPERSSVVWIREGLDNT